MPQRPNPELQTSLRFKTLVCVLVYLLTVVTDLKAQIAAPANQREDIDFAGLDIQFAIGWDNHVDLDAPVPLSFLISNHSATDLEGELVLTEPDTKRRIVIGEIFIGAGSVRRFSSVQALPDWFECVATFEGDQRYWRRELPISTGQDFSLDRNYLLFITDDVRTLSVPAAYAKPSQPSVFRPELAAGHEVETILVKTWQVPQHLGPMTVAQAMLFAEGADAESLNAAQWEAIGKWICLGGTVLLHNESKAVLEQIEKSVPLPMMPASITEPLAVRRCGHGSVQIYSTALFGEAGSEAVTSVFKAVSTLPHFSLATLLEGLHPHRTETENAETSRAWVLTLFGVYTLLSGAVTLFLFRLSRRHLMIYGLSVVGGTSLLAALLGARLATKNGDLLLASITVGTDQGALQLMRLDATSAGGRNSTLTATGPDIDVQLTDPANESYQDNWYGYWNQVPSQVSWPSFTWQPSLLEKDDSAFQLNVPTTPWGRRQLLATAFDPEWKGLKVELQYVPTMGSFENDVQHGTQVLAADVQILNLLPVAVRECRLVVVIGVPFFDEHGNMYRPHGEVVQPLGRDGIGFSELSYVSPSTAADAGSSASITSFQVELNRSGVTREGINLSRSAFFSPRLTSPSGFNVWIMAVIANSSFVSIDKQRSDFDAVDGSHVYAQRLPDDAIPTEWKQLQEANFLRQFDAVKEAAKQAAQARTQLQQQQQQ